MFDEEALKRVMAAVLRVPEAQIGPDTSTDTLPTWDSLRHMNLVLALEQEFDVSIPDEDAANLSSYALIKLVLNELMVD
ncbi:acyl carrier protein [Caulobacter sp. AP07]|uniref:acyl carrier protein n=1 Tax=Caulobacter sp. AP07 TaxID=1144304 RepID=UPI00027200EF|nr:acyl carrier protein [Caulobacter sp. AP07]EJL38190.1 acyl carrier protein [Caulobacter sp. AP07]